MNEEELKKLLERVESIERTLTEKENRIATLENENKELLSKMASLKVDSLVNKVNDTPSTPVVEEDVQFDFDI